MRVKIMVELHVDEASFIRETGETHPDTIGGYVEEVVSHGVTSVLDEYPVAMEFTGLELAS